MTTKDCIYQIIEELREEYEIPHAMKLNWKPGFDPNKRLYTLSVWMNYPLNDYEHFHFWSFPAFKRDEVESQKEALKMLIEVEIIKVIGDGAEAYGYDVFE
jgi:hypothetical protein